MKDELYNVKMHQLGEIIKNNNYPSQEIKRQDYILVNYLLDLIKEENYQSKTKEKIIQALEEAFEKTNKQDIKDGIFNEYVDYLSKTIKNNKIISTLKKYKDNYSIIYDILSIPEINKLSTKHKEEIIKVTIEEEIAREEFIDTFFRYIPEQRRRNLKSIISTTAKNYFDTINNIYAYNIEDYKNELEITGREDFAKKMFESTYTIDYEEYWFNFYNSLNIPYKPMIENDLEKYYLSLILDNFSTYKTKQKNIDCSIQLLNLNVDQIAENKNVLKYAITEKAVSKIRETYNNLSKYITNNELLSKIGMEPLYQNKHNKSILSLCKIYMGTALEENDLLPLDNIIYPDVIPTKMKMEIQRLWDNKIMNDLFEKFSFWLEDYDDDDLLFDKVYQENKKEFMNIINSGLDRVESIYKKLKESIPKTTFRVLEDNKKLLYNSIDNESLNRISLKSQKEREFALNILKYILSGKTENSYFMDRTDINEYPNINEEVKKRIIVDMYATTYIYLNENPYPSTYEPKIKANISEIDYNYLTLLEDNKKLLEELNNSTKKLYLNLEGYYNKNDSLYHKVQKHIINELDLNVILRANTHIAQMLDVIESEQKKYSFITFINNYYNYLNINHINCRIYVDNIIECFYNKYSQIMNQIAEKKIERKTEDDFKEYLIFGAENYIQREISNIEDLKCFELSDFSNYLEYIKEEYIKENLSEDNKGPKRLTKK